MDGVTYISSTGLGFLMYLVKNRKDSVYLSKPGPAVLKPFDLLGIQHLFRYYHALEDLEKKPEAKDQEISGRSETAADLAGISGGWSWQAGGGEGGSGTGGGAGFGPGAGGGVGSGYGQGVGNGRGLPNARMQYLKEHFAYIRDLIMKHLSYPQMARKMGWKGKVIVAFVIRENGTVENSRVVRSSGYDVLDHNTLKTIRDAQPFPKPPVKAELVIPIVYKLE
jgi:protein TonB